MTNRIPPSRRPERQPDPEEILPPGQLMISLADPDFRQAIRDAGIVFGVDVLDESNRSLFYGKATLERIARTGKGKGMLVVNVPIDFASDDVEALCAACLTLKGSCCYNGDDDEPEMINPDFN
jgi:hypothetical protein